MLTNRSSLNSDAPVLAMLERAKAEPLTQFVSLDLAGDVEDYVPGYLAFEREGREEKYDPSPLIRSYFGYK